MELWQIFEAELDCYDIGDRITNRTFAEDWDIEPRAASIRIQRYLAAQRAKKAKTKYVLVREDRTSNAIWTIGRRAEDARNDLGQFADDMKRRVSRALNPDLLRIGAVNPQARKSVEQGLEPIVDGMVQMLVGVMHAVGWNGQDG